MAKSIYDQAKASVAQGKTVINKPQDKINRLTNEAINPKTTKTTPITTPIKTETKTIPKKKKRPSFLRSLGLKA